MTKGNQIDLSKYGSAEERAPYLEASIGRPVMGEQLHELTENLGKVATLLALETLGLKYLAGTEIAPKTKFGMYHPGEVRLRPDEVITKTVDDLKQKQFLKVSSGESVTIPIESLFLKRRRQKQKDIGFLLVAKARDIPTTEYPVAGQLLAEKTVVMKKFKQKSLDLTQALTEIEHHIPLATGSMDDFRSFKKQLRYELLSSGTSVTLGPIGHLHTPRPKYP